MSSRRVHRWVWWLLPFLVARALLPVGFMAQASEGRLQVVLCKAGFAGPVWVDVDGKLQASEPQATSHTSSSPDSSHQGADNDHPCLFAHATAAPVLHLGGGELIDVFADSYIPTISAPPYLAVGPPRFIATRGPPAYA